MSETDFAFVIYIPFLGGFFAFVLASIFKTNEPAIIILLGVIAGYLGLIAYTLNKKYEK